jgi:hypothetical protein
MTQMRHAFFVAADLMRRTALNPRIRLLVRTSSVCVLFLLLSGCSRKSVVSSHEVEPDITGSSSDPAVNLKCELKPDQRYTFHLETEYSYSSSKWKFGIGSQETHVSTDYAVTVTNETSKAHKQLDVEYLGLGLQVFSGDESKLYFDSENHAVPMAGDFAETMRSLIHGHFGVELSKRDTVSKDYGLDQ